MKAQTQEATEDCPCCGKHDCLAYRSRIGRLEGRIAALEEQNARLSASAEAFADLSDRLNARLFEERTGGTDRAFKTRSRDVGFGRSDRRR